MKGVELDASNFKIKDVHNTDPEQSLLDAFVSAAMGFVHQDLELKYISLDIARNKVTLMWEKKK